MPLNQIISLWLILELLIMDVKLEACNPGIPLSGISKNTWYSLCNHQNYYY